MLDLHAKQVTECRQLDGATAKPAQQWSPWKLSTQVENWVKEGIKVYSCYEAGACGYWYHRELTKVGAVNFVVVPRQLENQCIRHQKTDRLDARALLDRLEKYLGGNRYAMSLVAVPSVEEEQQRSLVRYREQLMRDRRRAEARGRAIALCQGIEVPAGWWREARWREFRQELPSVDEFAGQTLERAGGVPRSPRAQNPTRARKKPRGGTTDGGRSTGLGHSATGVARLRSVPQSPSDC